VIGTADEQVKVDVATTSTSKEVMSKTLHIAKVFQPRWLQLYSWLEYDKKLNLMTCSLCKSGNKKNTFVSGTDNFRTSTLARHVTSGDHTILVMAGPRSRQFEAAINKALTKEENGVIVALRTIYWITKESLPLSKFQSTLQFLRDLKTPNVENPLYAESIRGDVYNSNTGDLLVSLYSVPVDGVVSPFTFNGNAGGYSIETTVQYAGGDENATASDTTSFTLRNRPVTPPPSTGGGTDSGGSTGGGGGGRD